MKRLLNLFIVMFVTLFMTYIANAAEDIFVKSCSTNQIIFSTGVKTNTFSQAMQPLFMLVPDMFCERTDSTGGDRNVELLLGMDGDAEAAIVPADVIEYKSRTNPEAKKLRSIISLWGNALHIAVNVNGYTTPKYGGMGKDVHYIQEFKDLVGMPVAVFGSPKTSARVIDERLKMHWDIVEVNSLKEGWDKLEKGEVKAFMVMGGWPIQYIQELDPKKFTLINVDPATITTLGSPYYTTKLNYPKIGVNGFNAITAKNEVMVRNYTTQRWVTKYIAMYHAFKDNLVDLQEMRGAHAAWKLIQDPKDMDTLINPIYEPLKKVLDETATPVVTSVPSVETKDVKKTADTKKTK